MAGPAKLLEQSGTGGRYKSNIKRDMIRKAGKVVARFILSIDFLIIGYRGAYILVWFAHWPWQQGTPEDDPSPSEGGQAEKRCAV